VVEIRKTSNVQHKQRDQQGLNCAVLSLCTVAVV